MAILTRLARLLRADMHALLDRMEAPDVLLQQALRDMQEDLQAQQQQQKQRLQQLQQFDQQLQGIENQKNQFQTELDLCLDSNNDALARTFLRRQLEADQRSQQLQAQKRALQLKIQQVAEELEKQQADFESLQLQADTLTLAQQISAPSNRSLDIQVTEADIEIALLKAKKSRSPS